MPHEEKVKAPPMNKWAKFGIIGSTLTACIPLVIYLLQSMNSVSPGNDKHVNTRIHDKLSNSIESHAREIADVKTYLNLLLTAKINSVPEPITQQSGLFESRNKVLTDIPLPQPSVSVSRKPVTDEIEIYTNIKRAIEVNSQTVVTKRVTGWVLLGEFDKSDRLWEKHTFDVTNYDRLVTTDDTLTLVVETTLYETYPKGLFLRRPYIKDNTFIPTGTTIKLLKVVNTVGWSNYTWAEIEAVY